MLRLFRRKKDIRSKADVEKLVHTFYEYIGQDALLGPAFNEVASVNWETHLPKMVLFWESLIFRQPGYKGNPLAVHRNLGKQMRLTPDHFDHWIALFQRTVDELFVGPRAELAKESAAQIGDGMIHSLFEHRFDEEEAA